jgi:hypothetical protein
MSAVAGSIAALLAVGIGLAQPAPRAASTTPPSTNALDAAPESIQVMLSARRIYVESFGDDPISKTLQSMVVDAIGSTKRFIVTENKDKADLILKGSALEKTSQEIHSLGSSTVVAGAAGGSRSTISAHEGQLSGASNSSSVAHKTGISDSQASTETVNDARAAVRLLSKDGDVVWSTTQESKGAKYRSATADVADKIVKQLMRDLVKLEESRPK